MGDQHEMKAGFRRGAGGNGTGRGSRRRWAHLLSQAGLAGRSSGTRNEELPAVMRFIPVADLRKFRYNLTYYLNHPR